MTILDHCRAKAQAKPLRVALPEVEEPRVLRAARRLVDEGLAIPVLVGDPDAAAACAAAAGVSLDGIALTDATTDADAPARAERVAASRGKPMTEALMRRLAAPLNHAGCLLTEGVVDAMVGGAATPTRDIIRAALLTVGPAAGVTLASSWMLMLLPDGRSLIYADPGMNPDPSADELADIAIATGASAEAVLGRAPRIALLSFSTYGSATHPRVAKVTEALAAVRARAPHLIIDGELQGDAALNPEIAARKGSDSPVAGRADVLVFPDLDSGNISYKITQELAGAQALGPFLQGFARPVCDLSRGASVDDIVNAAVVTLAMA